MLAIWGNADSVNVQKVLWCCEEIGLAYQRTDAGRHFGVVDTQQFRGLNPNGLVPTIVDEGFVLWESNAIVRYLCAKHASGTLWPLNVRERAEADRWMDWSSSTLWPALRPLFRGLVRTPQGERDQRTIDAARLETLDALEILESRLAASAYAGGAVFSMGDIALGCAVWRWMALPVDRPPLPALQRWFDALAQRPAYRKVVMLPLV